MGLVPKHALEGTCKLCAAPVMKHMVFMESPDTVRGITLEAGTKQTGYWCSCTNVECPNNYGEGTLPSRPRDASLNPSLTR